MGRAIVPISAAVAGSAVVYTAALDPAEQGWFPSCLFRSSTGLLCPGCGMTRALHHLTHGDVSTAIGYNPLIIPLAVGLVVLAVVWVVARRRGREIRFSLPPAWSIAAIVSLVGFGIVRNLIDIGAAAAT